jgi:hypothetical protein
MGQFKIEIIAIGGHGQDRDKKNGEKVDFREGGNTTPDAIAHRAVNELKSAGVNVESAKIIHWPGSESEVIDDLLTEIRTGNF